MQTPSVHASHWSAWLCRANRDALAVRIAERKSSAREIRRTLRDTHDQCIATAALLKRVQPSGRRIGAILKTQSLPRIGESYPQSRRGNSNTRRRPRARPATSVPNMGRHRQGRPLTTSGSIARPAALDSVKIGAKSPFLT